MPINFRKQVSTTETSVQVQAAVSVQSEQGCSISAQRKGETGRNENSQSERAIRKLAAQVSEVAHKINSKTTASIQFDSNSVLLNEANNTPRTPISVVLDTSGSVSNWLKGTLSTADKMIEDFRLMPATRESIVFDLTQIGSPPISTGFKELKDVIIPDVQAIGLSPIALGIKRATLNLASLIGRLREKAIERTEGVVIITTDGFENVSSKEEFDAILDEFHSACARWSVTPIVVGVGDDLDVPTLKKMAKALPPFHLRDLTADVLIPFIKKIAIQASRSRRGQKLELDLPDELVPLQ